MKVSFFKTVTLLLILGSWIACTSVLAAPPSTALLKAKNKAEAKGYIFETSHDEIVAKAKKEGKLRVLSSQEADAINATRVAFMKRYPFIDVRAEEVSGLETYMRMLQEMKAGMVKNWDVNYIAFDFYDDYLPYQKKFDILGMAKHGVLKMPRKLIDPANRHIVALQSNIQVVGYNKKLISADKVPDSWKDFLKPEFKGRKFITDVRPKIFAALVPVWGLEKTLVFARKIAAQNPIWFRGDSRTVTFVLAGEVGLALGPNYKTLKRIQRKDPMGILGYKVLEPVPTRLTEAEGVLAAADNPYAALLWLEFQTSPEGQKILDKIDLAASIFSPGSAHEKVTRGKKLSVMAWEHYSRMRSYQKKIVEAYGFPTSEHKRKKRKKK